LYLDHETNWQIPGQRHILVQQAKPDYPMVWLVNEQAASDSLSFNTWIASPQEVRLPVEAR
jgi:hypothetical protein